MEKYFDDKYIKEKYSELPETIKTIIKNSNWESKILEISQNNKLRIDQGGILEREVVYIMLGVDEIEKFKSNLEKEAGINPGLSQKIAHEVAEKVFNPITAELVKISEESSEDSFEYTTEEPVKPQIHNSLPQAQQAPQPPAAQNTPAKQPEPPTPKQNDIISQNLSTPEVQAVKKIDPYLEPLD